MNRRRIVFYVVTALVVMMGIFAIFGMTNSVINFQATTPTHDDPAMLQAGFDKVTPTATQDDVIGLMGSHFRVDGCPPRSDSDAGGPVCAHIWHYQEGEQAWDLKFDMDGNLMSKKIGEAN